MASSWQFLRMSASEGERPLKTTPFLCFQMCQTHKSWRVSAEHGARWREEGMSRRRQHRVQFYHARAHTFSRRQDVKIELIEMRTCTCRCSNLAPAGLDNGDPAVAATTLLKNRHDRILPPMPNARRNMATCKSYLHSPLEPWVA